MNIFDFFIEKNISIEDLSIKNIENELKKTIGINTANCPYCGCNLEKFPIRKTKCKNCNNDIYVGKNPYYNCKILITEEEKEKLKDLWEKWRYFNNATKPKKYVPDKKVEEITIDSTAEMNIIINDLIKHHRDYWNYKEILNIKKEHRLSIQKYIWRKWASHSYWDTLVYAFPEYSEKEMRLIGYKEHFRVNMLNKLQLFIKTNKSTSILGMAWLIEYHNFIKSDIENDKVVKLCKPEDMPYIYDAWLEGNDKINHIVFNLAGNINAEQIYLYVNGIEKLISKEYLKEFCIKHKYQYPILDVNYKND